MTIVSAATTTVISCDYLVIGAGAASLAFIDTLLSERPTVNIALVDRKPRPGGHWGNAYGYVTLHQPSLLYGLASRQLEGNWLKLLLLKRILPWKHRANKKELMAYFGNFVDDAVKKGNMEYFPECSYEFVSDAGSSEAGGEEEHTFVSLDGRRRYAVTVKEKLVNGILGECIIPSLCPVQFPVNEKLDLITPTELFDRHHDHADYAKMKSKHFVILGFGKTAFEAIVYLQRTMKVPPAQISVVIPCDVWMLSRDGKGAGGPWDYPRALLRNDGDEDRACSELEEQDTFMRLDKNVKPTRFRFPTVSRKELKLMQQVPKANIVRKGRVTSIELTEGSNNGDVMVNFGSEEKPWVINSEYLHDTVRAVDACVFVHCTSPGPFNGFDEVDRSLFPSNREIDLLLLFAPPVSISMSCLAELECSRLAGTLDVSFGKTLLKEGGVVVKDSIDDLSANDVLRLLVRSLAPSKSKCGLFQAILNLAIFLALVDEDPLKGHKWMKANRLSFLSIPNFKSGIVTDLEDLVTKGDILGFTVGQIKMFQCMVNKLEPLRDL